MIKLHKGIIPIVVLSLFFFMAGCSKSGVDQVEEITPPETGATTEAPGMEIEMPDVEEGVDVAAGATMEEAMANFQDIAVYFDFDRFSLSPEARKALAEKASFLNAHPEIKIRIEGHCDERGTREYNLALGERRAKSAQDYLIFLGINPARVSTISYGEERPVDPASNEAAWSKNRRAEFVIIGR
ncbi:MAG TPA: peptidoglycan-associated lipoprotein Pal [Deltaproteobacteria bacterium]|nr:peptidoglycan-associated lipoprotein Pal [Deltaproteobacteria bacterium]